VFNIFAISFNKTVTPKKIPHARFTQKINASAKNMCCLPPAFCLAKKMAAQLGGGEVLQQTMQCQKSPA